MSYWIKIPVAIAIIIGMYFFVGVASSMVVAAYYIGLLLGELTARRT